MAEKLIRHRNWLLFAVLLTTMLVSCLATIRRLEEETKPVSLPVMQTISTTASALEQFRQERDETAAGDLARLQQLSENAAVDQQLREDAAEQLQQMIDRRERQTALEGALTMSGIAPCVAVITGGSVTIVTEKETLTEGESALVVTLAGVHAGIEPSGVRVMTGKTE